MTDKPVAVDLAHGPDVAERVRRFLGRQYYPALCQLRVLEDQGRVTLAGDVYRDVRRALIAYSGSMESAKTMKRFIQLRLWPDVAIRIVSFWQHGALRDAETLVRKAAAYCQAHGFVPETDCVHGVAKSGLLPYAAEWGADLIVLGNSARNLLVRRIFGDTALNVIELADRPLFLCQ